MSDQTATLKDLKPFSPSSRDGLHLGSWRSDPDRFGNTEQVDVFYAQAEPEYRLPERVTLSRWKFFLVDGVPRGHASGSSESYPVDAVPAIIAALQGCV